MPHCHFRKIATVSHFRLVYIPISLVPFKLGRGGFDWEYSNVTFWAILLKAPLRYFWWTWHGTPRKHSLSWLPKFQMPSEIFFDILGVNRTSKLIHSQNWVIDWHPWLQGMIRCEESDLECMESLCPDGWQWSDRHKECNLKQS